MKYYDYYEDIDYDKISNDIKVILPNKDHHRFGGSEWLRGKPHKNKLVERLSFIIYRERIKCKEFDRYYHFKVKNHFKIDDKLKIFRKYVTLKKIIFNKLKIILNL